ncbi:hypothetical protein [Neobacillus niacini]|uniref:hypothetical protein n=1 Tax=Neobacillus niacini TaxID=86668 RepID=UPI00286C1F39|nr:hypothetical protein [Neobacillus niacini]
MVKRKQRFINFVDIKAAFLGDRGDGSGGLFCLTCTMRTVPIEKKCQAPSINLEGAHFSLLKIPY